jgi:TonB family protein
MEAFIEYVLQSSIYLSLLIIIYRLFFKKETFFKLNRFFLLFSIVLSCCIIPITLYFIQSFSKTNLNTFYLQKIIIHQSASNQTSIANFNIITLFFDVYFFILVILLIKLLIQILQILRLYIVSSINSYRPTIIYTDDHPPFSFFNLIFINKSIHKDEAEKIILHESIHANQYHSLDILLIEIVCIFYWFNPFIWLYKASFREIHEFLADEGVLNKSYDKKAYQLLLLSVATGINDWKPSNKFNSLIKKRMIMMSKQKSTNASLVKYALVLLLVTFFWVLPSVKIEKSYASNRISISSSTSFVNAIPQSKEEIYKEVDVVPEFEGGQKAMIDFLVNNVKYPDAEKQNGIQGTVYVTFVVETDGSITDVRVLRGVNQSLDNEAVRVIKLMSKKWKAGTHKGKLVRVQFNLPIKFALEKEKK